MRYILCSLLLSTLAGTKASAVELAPTPVQNAMRVSIALSDWSTPIGANLADDSDDFGGSSGSSTLGRKSLFKSVLYSTLVPGGGQFYLGKRRTARYFFAVEAMTWIGYFSFRTYGNWRRDDYVNYAAVHANAQLEGKSDDFLNWVGFYENIRDFNNLGRAFDPERGYLPDTPENHWEWKSREERQTYRDLHNRSKEAYRRSDFMIGLAIVDRVVSIIDAVRSTGKINRRLGGDAHSDDQNRTFKLSVNPFSVRRQVCFTFYPGF